jgi:glycosyltransferase involved in cell wall biosynthesis
VNSKSEAFVIVAIEAMACGTPVIATNVGGTGELIQHETNGWLVPTKEDALQTALLTFHDQPELRARLGEAGKQIVFAKLTAEKFIWNLEDFLVQSVSEANGGAEYLVTGPNALVN